MSLRLTKMERIRLEHRLGAHLVEIPLQDGDGAVGRTLQEICVPPQCVIASIRRGGRVLIPRGHTRLEAGDVIIALVTEDGEEALRSCLTSGGSSP